MNSEKIENFITNYILNDSDYLGRVIEFYFETPEDTLEALKNVIRYCPNYDYKFKYLYKLLKYINTIKKDDIPQYDFDNVKSYLKTFKEYKNSSSYNFYYTKLNYIELLKKGWKATLFVLLEDEPGLFIDYDKVIWDYVKVKILKEKIDKLDDNEDYYY